MKPEVFSGRYVFHFHASETDGRSTIDDYLTCARRHRLERVIFLEHIRQAPRYDVAGYARRVAHEGERLGIDTRLGFEAKVLPSGELDIAPEHAALAEVIGIAEHGFPDDRRLQRSAFRRAAARAGDTWPDKLLVWVHPGLWLKKRGRLEEQRADHLEMLEEATALGLRIECNRRHDLLAEADRSRVPPVRLVHGLDAHSVAEMDEALRKQDGSAG